MSARLMVAERRLPNPAAELIARTRDVALVVALGSFVLAAALINAGFWAAAVRAEATAELLSGPAIVALSLAGISLAGAAAAQLARVGLSRP